MSTTRIRSTSRSVNSRPSPFGLQGAHRASTVRSSWVRRVHGNAHRPAVRACRLASTGRRRGAARLGEEALLGQPAALYTFARNRVARAFYERHGFVLERQAFEPHWQLDDVLYRWQELRQRFASLRLHG